MRAVGEWLRKVRAASRIEFGLIAALIAIAIISAMSAVGGRLHRSFTGATQNRGAG